MNRAGRLRADLPGLLGLGGVLACPFVLWGGGRYVRVDFLLPKTLVLEVALVAGLVALLVAARSSRDPLRWIREAIGIPPRLAVPLLLLLGLAMGSIAWGINAREASLTTGLLLGQIGCAALAAGWIRGVERARFVARLVTLAGVLVSLQGLVWYAGFTGWDRPRSFPGPLEMLFGLDPAFRSFLGGRNLESQWTAMAFVLAVTLGFAEERPMGRVLAALGTAVIGAALFILQTRGAWLALAVSFASIATFWVRDRRRAAPRKGSRRRGSLRTILVAAALVLAGAWFFGDALRWIAGAFAQRASTMLDPEHVTNTFRLRLWSYSLPMILDRPLLGFGWGLYRLAFGFYNLEGFEGSLGEPAVNHPHNGYLQLAIEIGVTGLVVLLVLVARGLRASRHEASAGRGRSWVLLHGFLAAAIVPLVHSLVATPLQMPAPGALFWLLFLTPLAARRARGELRGREASVRREGEGGRRAGLALAGVAGLTILAGFAATQAARAFVAGTLLERVRVEGLRDARGTLQGPLETSLNLWPDTQFAREILAYAARVGGRTGDAARQLLAALRDDPWDEKTYASLAMVYIRTMEWERGSRHLLPALKRYAASPGLLERAGMTERGSGRLREADVLSSRLYRLGLRAGAGLKGIQTIAMRTRNGVRAAVAAGILAALRHGGRNETDALVRLGSSLQLLGDLERAVDSLEEARSLNPANTRLWISLGECYQAQGRAADAAAAFLQAHDRGSRRPDLLYLAAASLVEAGREEEARQRFAEARRLHPELAATYEALARRLDRKR